MRKEDVILLEKKTFRELKAWYYFYRTGFFLFASAIPVVMPLRGLLMKGFLSGLCFAFAIISLLEWLEDAMETFRTKKKKR